MPQGQALGSCKASHAAGPGTRERLHLPSCACTAVYSLCLVCLTASQKCLTLLAKSHRPAAQPSPPYLSLTLRRAFTAPCRRAFTPWACCT